MWSNWKNTTECMQSNSDKGCGPGKMTQNRTCKPGNIDPCKEPFEVREMDCSIPCTTTGMFVSFDMKYYRLEKFKYYIQLHIYLILMWIYHFIWTK